MLSSRQIDEFIGESASTFCHLDVTPLNIFMPGSGDSPGIISLIDWESAALGTLASDCASLINSSLILGDVPADEAADFERVIYEDYLEGLADGGWHGDTALIRRQYLAVSIRRWISHVHLIAMYADETTQKSAEAYWKSPIDQLAPIRGPLTRLLLDRADELERLS